MSNGQRRVTNPEALGAALADAGVTRIEIAAQLSGVPSLRLAPGQGLFGSGEEAAIRFAPGQDGVELSADNRVEHLQLAADPDRRAIFNDTSVDSLGSLVLRKLQVAGVVQLLASGQVRSGHVEAHDIDIVAADARGYDKRPKGYGVEVITGAFTLWNQQADAAVSITADLTGLAAGRPGAPVRGSGIFVSGAGDAGGRLVVGRLETAAIHSDGGIAPGTPDRISGGVFTVYGTWVDTVRNLGPVTTYGPNDMVLDNWGTVDRWIAEEKITSYGPSGIGFVNFGTVNLLQVNAAVETFGQGARGFNVYTGTVHAAEFDRVVTHADGAIGIQISRPIGSLAVRRGIETFGGTGDSLVKGVVVKLTAFGLSIKPGGSAREIEIDGGLRTNGPDVPPIEQLGQIGVLRIGGGCVAAGARGES